MQLLTRLSPTPESSTVKSIYKAQLWDLGFYVRKQVCKKTKQTDSMVQSKWQKFTAYHLMVSFVMMVGYGPTCKPQNSESKLKNCNYIDITRSKVCITESKINASFPAPTVSIPRWGPAMFWLCLSKTYRCTRLSLPYVLVFLERKTWHPCQMLLHA